MAKTPRIQDKEVDSVTEEVINYQGYISRNGSGFVRLRDKIDDSSSVLISSDNSGDKTVITFLEECNFIAVFDSVLAGSNSAISIFFQDSVGTNKAVVRQDCNTYAAGSTTLIKKASVGDTLTVATEGGMIPQDSVETNFSVKATKNVKVSIGNL